jgi:opacity protein-like surface antigen
MMKKFLGYFLPLLLCSPVFAADEEHEGLGDLGFYSGLAATATLWQIDVDNQFTAPGFDIFTQIPHQSYDGWDWSAMFRIGGFLRWGDDDAWFSAIEAIAEGHDIYFETSDTTSDVNEYYVQKAEPVYTLGGQLKQGYFFNDDLLTYITAGLVFTEFKYTTVGYEGHHNATVSYEDKFTKAGFRLGVGSEYFLTDYLGLNFDVSYTWYQDETLGIYSQDFSPPSTTPIGETQFDPSAFALGLGFNFYFD